MVENAHIDRGIARIPIISMRRSFSHKDELINQLLFGESYSVTEESSDQSWLKILTSYDKYEGWIQKEQHHSISEGYFEQIGNTEYKISTDVSSTILFNRHQMNIVMGSILPISVNELFKMEEQLAFNGQAKSLGMRSQWDQIRQTALKYMYTPYLWGGKSTFGIDCSGLTQMVFRISGYFIARDASQQMLNGLEIDFTDMKPGDLAFFNNEEGVIGHVGIILEEGQIIHASGDVRIDNLTKKGIFKADGVQTHTFHQIRRILT